MILEATPASVQIFPVNKDIRLPSSQPTLTCGEILDQPLRAGLALASSQTANGYFSSPLATEQRAGVAKLAAGVCD